MTSGPPDFRPEDFLELARRLSRGRYQAEWRSAASRAYYAAFLQAREGLQQRGLIILTATGDDHRIVVRALRAIDRVQANRMDVLRRLRTRADYDLEARVSREDAMQAVLLAIRVIARL